MVINILLITLVFVRLVIGVRLFITGRNNHLPNLIWLSANMILTAVGLLFGPTPGNPLGNLPFSLWIFVGGAILTLIPVIVFNQLTFYKDRKSPAIWFWIVLLVCLAFTTYGIIISKSNYDQSIWVTAYIPVFVLVWAWHGWLANQALKQLDAQSSVERWVKTRYRLITFYSIVISLGAIVSFIRIVFAGGNTLSTLGSVTSLITLLAQIISVSLLFLVWVMPERFRLWLNRSQQVRSADEAQHPISMLNLFGEAMTTNTDLKTIVCFYAIRATIGKELGTEDSDVIRNRIKLMTYHDWETILQNAELRRILINGGADKIVAEKAIENARQALVENQSLLTLSTH